MEVQVISNEIIKPSSPTPDHLRHYQLSFLDQVTPKAYNPFLYYYELSDDHNIADISLKLKKSLSQALTLYYPLAGRYIDDAFVDCNDAGIPYSEARVAAETKLTDVLNNPVPRELNKLIPFEQDEIGEPLLGVQINAFACGGIAIGVCISHGVADALSSLMFTRSWMAIARGEHGAVPPPEFVSAGLFPPKDMRGYDTSFVIVKKDTVQSKRFVFGSPQIEALRTKYSQDGRRPSRVEALSAFIWSRFAAAARATIELKTTASGQFPLVIISHVVNIRPKFDPPLPEHSFGNLFRSSMTTPLTSSDELGLAKQIGDDIRKVDKEAVESFRMGGDEMVDSYKEGAERYAGGEVVSLVFTSLCRFPLYEADFGLGKPTWVSSAARCFKNMVGFMDNKAGDGIEAYVCLKPEDMARFEADEELLAFVS